MTYRLTVLPTDFADRSGSALTRTTPGSAVGFMPDRETQTTFQRNYRIMGRVILAASKRTRTHNENITHRESAITCPLPLPVTPVHHAARKLAFASGFHLAISRKMPTGTRDIPTRQSTLPKAARNRSSPEADPRFWVGNMTLPI